MEKTNGGNLIQIKNLVATVNLNNGDTLVTVNKANMELKRGNSYAIVGNRVQENKPYINYRFTQPLISRRISL